MFNLSIEKERFVKALGLVVGAVSEKRNSAPILGNILLSVEDNVLTLIGTDTEIEMVTKCTLDESFEESMSITVNAKKLMDVCRILPDKALIVFREKDNKLAIQSGKSRFSLATLPATEFPAIKAFSRQEKMFSMNAQDLKYLLQSTAFAMAQEDVRVYLNGLLLEKTGDVLTAVAMDGHRLAICKLPITGVEEDFRLVLPRKGIIELVKLLDLMGDESIRLAITDSHFFVDAGQHTFVTSRLNCQYPHYAAIIPKNTDKTLYLERDGLKQILTRVAVLANEKKRGIHFCATQNNLNISVNNAEQEAGEDEMDARMEGGDGFEANFNVQYIVDILNNLPSVEIKMLCSTAESGVLFESAVVPQVQYLIMPLKI